MMVLFKVFFLRIFFVIIFSMVVRLLISLQAGGLPTSQSTWHREAEEGGG